MKMEQMEKHLQDMLKKNSKLDLTEISRLQNIKNIINKVDVIKDINSNTQDINKKLQKHYMKKGLEKLEKIINITDELEKCTNNFKEKNISFREEIMRVSSFPKEFKAENLLDIFFKLFLPVRHILVISRNTNFRLIDFDDITKGNFSPQDIFLLLEDNIDFCYENLVLKKIDEYESDILQKCLKIDFNEQSIFCLGYILPQKKDIMETTFFLLLILDKKDEHFLIDYFNYEKFRFLNFYVLKNMMEIFESIKIKDSVENYIKEKMENIYNVLNFYIVELFLFQIKKMDSMKYFLIDENKFDFFDYKYFEVKNYNFLVYVKIEKNKDDLKNFKNLKKWINTHFDNFFDFFQKSFLKSNYQRKKKDYFFIVQQDNRIFDYQFISNYDPEIFDFSYKFNFLDKIDVFVRDKEFLEILKTNTILENFTKKYKFQNVFNYNNLKIVIRPNFILRNENKSEKELLVEMKILEKEDNFQIKFNELNINHEIENFKSEFDLNTSQTEKKNSFKKVFNKVKNDIDTEINQMNSYSISFCDVDIEKISENLGSNHFHNTILSEYVNNSKIVRYKSMVNEEKNIIIKDLKRRVSHFTCFPKLQDIIPKNSPVENQFNFYKNEEELINYKINYLSMTSKKMKFDTIYTMFKLSGWIEKEKINIPIFYNFLKRTEALYSANKNPYHNFDHALTTLNACFYILKNSNFEYFFEYGSIYAFLFSALMHDVDHTGNNNDYEINSMSKLALRFNNQHVLENHHCYVTFKLLNQKEFNFLDQMNKEDFMKFRKITIDLILMTDSKFHFEMLKKFSNCVKNFEKKDFVEAFNYENFITLAGNILHAADLHGPTKPPEESKIWSQKISLEFINQLRKEEINNLPVTSFFKDIQIPKKNIINEIFFVEKIVKPLWVAIYEFLDNDEAFKKELDNIDINLKNWEDKLEQILI
jgi:hypothetical protein